MSYRAMEKRRIKGVRRWMRGVEKDVKGGKGSEEWRRMKRVKKDDKS